MNLGIQHSDILQTVIQLTLIQRRNPGDTQTELSHSAYGDLAQSHRGEKIPLQKRY